MPELMCLFFAFSMTSFVCDNCLKMSNKTRKENKYAAKSECFFVFFLILGILLCWFLLFGHTTKSLQILFFLICQGGLWSLSLSHCRAAADQTGKLPWDAGQRLPEAAKSPRVRRGHHPRGSHLGQGRGGQTGHEVQVSSCVLRHNRFCFFSF